LARPKQASARRRAQDDDLEAVAASENGAETIPDWRLLVGYDGELDKWRALMARDAFPSPILLVGREGIGKRSLLLALAAMHLCATGTGCGTCKSCQMVLQGSHPEVLWLDAAAHGAFLLEDARALQDHLELSPGLGYKYRIVCIVDADRLSEAAANRLLKIMEEPPPQARLFFSTGRVGAMLATVLSRLVRWHVPPPAQAQSLSWLRERGRSLDMVLPDDEALLELLRHAGLAPGLAWRRLQDGASGGAANLGAIPTHLSAGELVGWAEAVTRRAGRSAAALVEEWDLAINAQYHDMIRKGDYPIGGLRERYECREMLRRARRLARGARVPLNAQLLAEALLLTQRS